MKIHGKTVRTALLALLVASGTGAAFAQTSLSAEIHAGPGGTTVDVGYFYDDLASEGNWVQSPSYGWVWSPRSVASDWRPYRDGNWVWSDQGWTWVSNEPYGWATYHYGRWYDDPQFGWAWVPGNDWAPAWVSWQEGGDYIGWAPLPPSVNVAVGFSGALSVSLGYDAYLFVPERQFLAPRLSGYYVSSSQVPVIYRQTRNITNYRYTDNRVYNTGVAVDRIQRATGHPVQRYTLADLNATGGGNRRAQISGTRLNVFRLRVQRTANVAPPPSRPIARKAVVTPTQLQASRPNRAGRPAAAQNGAAPQTPVTAQGAQNAPKNPRNRQGNQPANPTPPATQERNNPLPTHRTPPVEAAPKNPKNEVQPRPEAPPKQPKPRMPPAQQERQRVQPPQEEKQRTPPPPQQDRQRTQPPPQQEQKQRVQPPPQQERPNRQAPPPEQRQRPAAPEKQQPQRQQPPPKDREKPQQDEHKPPVR